MYHRTSRDCVESVLKNGLNCNKSGFICLSFRPNSWKGLHKESALFQVDIIGLKPEHLKVWKIDETDEMCIWIKNIPPERLRIMLEID